MLISAFGQDQALTFHRRQPQQVATFPAESGFGIHAELVRKPDGDGVESTAQAYVFRTNP